MSTERRGYVSPKYPPPAGLDRPGVPLRHIVICAAGGAALWTSGALTILTLAR